MNHTHAQARAAAPRPLLRKRWMALALAFAAIAGVDVGAQGLPASLVPVKKIFIYGTDPRPASMASREAIWSPDSLAWSPDGQRIAFGAHSVRQFGVLDLKTEKITPIDTGFYGSGTVHWSSKLNRLAVVQPIETSVYDMSTSEPKLLFVIQNKFPKVLDTIGANIVTVVGEDYLVLVGTTNWRVDKTNPHIAAYNLRTGERKWTYQFLNPDFEAIRKNGATDVRPIKATATSNARGDLLVAVHTNRTRSVQLDPAGRIKSSVSDEAVWVINLSQGKEQCHIDMFASPTIQRSQYGDPWGGLYALSPDPRGQWLLISHTQFKHVYDLDTCSFRQALEPELDDGDHSPAGWKALASSKASVSTTKVSPDGRWLVGYGPWAAKPDKAPLRLWRTADWSQAVDVTRISDGGTIDGEISRDGSHLAFAETNRLTIYRIKE